MTRRALEQRIAREIGRAKAKEIVNCDKPEWQRYFAGRIDALVDLLGELELDPPRDLPHGDEFRR